MVLIAPVTCPALTGTSSSIFQTFITTILSAQCTLDTTNLYPNDCGPNLSNEDEFDFIIVGGGNAGSVLASRLSEISSYRVLLLETGGIPSSTSEIPGLAAALFGTAEDWNFKTEPSDNHCKGFKEGRCSYHKGKMLGGSSSIDFMAFFRGTNVDYDNWQAMGNKGWCTYNVLPYFIKLQDVRRPELINNPNFGVGGYIPTVPVEPQEYFKLLETAALQTGLAVNDFSLFMGFFESMLTVENGRRVNTAKAYLGPAKKRTNLCVALNAHVTKILINNQKIATGVSVKIGQRTLVLKARKEVIISAGTINSAQILMLSGIGPKDQLDNCNIKMVSELPVGYNLQDHLGMQGAIIRVDDYPGLRTKAVGSFEEIYRYFTEFKGPYTSSMVNLYAYFSTIGDPVYPNLYSEFAHYPKNNEDFLRNALDIARFNNKSIQSLIELNKQQHLLLTGLSLLNPKSTGRVTLKSNDPFEKPLINANYLSNPDDIKLYLDAIEVFDKIYLQTPIMKNLNAAYVDFKIPGCENIPFNTRPYWECNLKSLGNSFSRPVGTCKMGSSIDETAVVNNRLVVYGFRNLRVVGSSIMPKIVSANSHIATIMIAEKASDMIKEDWYIDSCGNNVVPH